MKTSIITSLALVASATAFAPSRQSSVRTGTQLAEKKTFFKTIFEMDLFAPKADQNDYGARGKKSLTQGKIGSGSYVPSGLTAAQYQKLREDEQKKKQANYEKNVKKAGIFQDYTDFYLKRGTDTSESWAKSVTKGHEMAKTKYDWSGDGDKPKWATKK